MTEQHRQGREVSPTPASNQAATQPGEPGAAPPNADLSSDGAASGTFFGLDLASGPDMMGYTYGGILGVTASHPAQVDGLVMKEIERCILAIEEHIRQTTGVNLGG